MVIAFLRTIILYLFIIVGIRLMGKRQVGELEPRSWCSPCLSPIWPPCPCRTSASLCSPASSPSSPSSCLTMALSVLTMKSVRFRAVLCGRPSIIVENGKLHQREMQKTALQWTS